MRPGEPDPAQLLAAAGLLPGIETPEVVASQFAVSRAVLALIWSVPANAEPTLIFTPGAAAP